jgi:hypothetical protein
MSTTLRASRTAVLVCQGRAAADGLIAAGRFADPTAMALDSPTFTMRCGANWASLQSRALPSNG